MEPPSPADKTADAERLRNALVSDGLTDVGVPLEVMQRLPAYLRMCNFSPLVSVVIGGLPSGGGAATPLKVFDLGRDVVYGLVVDIGSTNIEGSLMDLLSGAMIERSSIGNPQAAFGADVLTRVQRSMLGDYAAIREVLVDGLIALIGRICTRARIAPEEIAVVVVAGNTIMSHFLMGLTVENIPVSPYIPAVNGPVLGRARELQLPLHENAMVYIFPNAGSYVGGDIVSGILSSGMHREDEPVLFIDVGTNVEVALGCRDWIMVGAGAAGPALEGGVAGIGRTAEPGAISRVAIDPADGRLRVEVIGNVEPTGICGSGLIDLIAELFKAGIIDRSGKFTGAGANMTEVDGEQAFIVYREGDRLLTLKETEIRNFLLSKAAMFSFLYVFVRSVGLSFRDIRKLSVAGALGCGIDIDNAIAIGMLPDMPRERFVPLGNSSLAGAEMLMLDSGLLRDVDGIASMITYREMNEDPDLMNVLQGALFIPHTDPEVLKA
jgi:uncharacterized 2Fe-2S/4Fe-4S cluster protein (DUF4445 family)